MPGQHPPQSYGRAGPPEAGRFRRRRALLLDEVPPELMTYPVEKKFTDLIRAYSVQEQNILYQTMRVLARQAKKLKK